MASDVSSARELIEKGNNAYERSEFKKAVECYEQALEIAQEIGDRQGEGNALGNLGMLYRATGEIKKAIKCYEKALEIARENGYRQLEGKTLDNLGDAYSDLGELRKAIENHEQALEIARENGYRQLEGNILSSLGNAYRDIGEVKKAIEIYEQALEIARENGYRQLEGNILSSLGNAYRYIGEVKKAIEYIEQAIDVVRDIGAKINEGRFLGNLGGPYFDLGDLRKAIEYHEKALEIAKKIGDRGAEGVWLNSLGEANMVLGDWDKSLQLYNDALKIFKTMESLTRQGKTLSNIGELQIKSGEWEDARKNLEEALEMYNRTTPVGAIDVLVNLGELDSVEDNYENAFSDFQKALTIASELELNPKKVKIFNKMGRAYLMEFGFNKSQESLAQAKKYSESALKLAKDLQRPLDQGISLRNLGIVYFKYSQINESKDYFIQSLKIFQTFGARYELARTYLELAKTLVENNALLEAEEKTKVCAFDAIRGNFKELEVRSYMLLGDIVWKQDNTQYGYYLTALKTAIFNPTIYARTIFLLIGRMKRMEKDTTLEFIESLKEVNLEVHFGTFLSALASKIRGKDYSVEGLPMELKEEFDNFTIASK
jgi:tetratricopeptide (TPR) repeat protein